VAGLYGALGIVSALQARTRTGRGQRVQSALTNGLISMLAYLSAEFFATGQVPERTGNDHPLVAPYGLFQAEDATVAVAPSNDAFVRRFLDALELGHLLDDPRFDDNAKRMARRDELKEMIDARMRRQPRAHWIETLNAAGVPCGKVMNLAEVFDDPQVLSQEMVLEIDQGDGRTVKTTGFPIKLEETPCAVYHPVPELGADTADVLREHGYDADAIARLRADGAI
jgi:crotonobetainyl-CoA:carnitine CoA-transferase CaiB-like acyl-CoA transferase